jgi:hypothetical protein
MKRASLMVLLSLCLGACESPEAKLAKQVDDLERRASFDLNCPREQIDWTTLSERSRGATGCGRQASYVWVCRQNPHYAYEDTCEWFMNGAATR